MCGPFLFTDMEVQSVAKVERIEPDRVEVFDNKISEALIMFCEENGIKDLKTESQNVWNGALMYVRRYAFPDKSILKSNKRNTVDGNNIQSNYNAYDYDLVNSICDYYIYICSMYDKEISINGFSYLTGIDRETIRTWGDDRTKLSKMSLEIFKKLYEGREESLSAKLVTGNKNPVGILATLNRWYQWNMPGVSREHTIKAPATIDALPDLTQQIEKKD